MGSVGPQAADSASAEAALEQEKAASEKVANPAKFAAMANVGRTYALDTDFRILQRESGSMRMDLPIFAANPGTFKLSDTPPEVTREDYPEVEGCFMLHNVLTPEECEQIIAISESMGYTEDAPVSLGRNIRQNDNCVWISNPDFTDAIFERCRAHFPQEVDGGKPVGINMRWRLYKYNPNDIFKIHTDGSWPGSGVDPKTGRLVQDLFGDRWSQLTWVLYLNDDFKGGATKFYKPVDARHVAVSGETPAVRGSACCFFHGQHPLSHLHEGALVTEGTKYIIRSDVLYSLPQDKESVQAAWQRQYQK